MPPADARRPRRRGQVKARASRPDSQGVSRAYTKATPACTNEWSQRAASGKAVQHRRRGNGTPWQTRSRVAWQAQRCQRRGHAQRADWEASRQWRRTTLIRSARTHLCPRKPSDHVSYRTSMRTCPNFSQSICLTKKKNHCATPKSKGGHVTESLLLRAPHESTVVQSATRQRNRQFDT